MKKVGILILVLVLALFVVYKSAKAQRPTGQIVRLRILKVTEAGVQPRTLQGEPEIMGFSCTSSLANEEPTCYVLLRDRVF